MNHFNISYIKENENFHLSLFTDQATIIIFDDKHLAHKHGLTLLMEPSLSPELSPHRYELLETKQNKYYYKLITKTDTTVIKDDSCCESGCPGCPWTIAQERKGQLIL